jgi:hypothetical protein
MELFDELERRRGEVERHKENTARLAQEFHKFDTAGQGSMEFADSAKFDITFVEEPYVTFASAIDLDAWAELLGIEDPNVTPPMPVVSGFVTEWDQDHRDFYVGAWLGVSVYFPAVGTITVPAEAMPELVHHFTFTGIALKDVPLDVRDD